MNAREISQRLRRAAKPLVFGTIDSLGMNRCARARLAGRLVILTYHSFCERPRKGLFSSLPIAMLERHLLFLRRHYDVVSLMEGLRRLEAAEGGRRPMAAITIDDGFGDNYALAFPVLKKHGVPATIFLATDFIDNGRPPWPTQIVAALEATEHTEMDWPVRMPLRSLAERGAAARSVKAAWRRHDGPTRLRLLEEFRARLEVRETGNDFAPLTWRQVREMGTHGITFGSHTVYHSMIDVVSPRMRREELHVSRQRLETELERPCESFAYPDGAHDSQSRIDVADAGYRLAVTQQAGSNSRDSNFLQLRRMEIPAHDPEPAFRFRTGGGALDCSHRELQS